MRAHLLLPLERHVERRAGRHVLQVGCLRHWRQHLLVLHGNRQGAQLEQLKAVSSLCEANNFESDDAQSTNTSTTGAGEEIRSRRIGEKHPA